MFCPNCGSANSEEQRFCRSCGLSLEKTLQSLAEQLPARELYAEIRRRQRIVERLLRIVGIGAISLVVGAVLWGIVFEVMIAKGEILAGSLFLVFIFALILFASLAIYKESLARSSKGYGDKEIGGSTEGLSTNLANGTQNSIPSVIEKTTELFDDFERSDAKKT